VPDYREITITIVEGEEVAVVWTNLPRYARRLLKLGAKVIYGDPRCPSGAGVRLECPEAWFYPRKRRVGGAGRGNLEALRKAQAQRRDSMNEGPKEG
jgi:hypothetical protein